MEVGVKCQDSALYKEKTKNRLILYCFNLILHVVNEWLERSTKSALLSSKRLQSWWRLLALQFSPQFCTFEVSFLSSDHLLSLLVVCPMVNENAVNSCDDNQIFLPF